MNTNNNITSAPSDKTTPKIPPSQRHSGNEPVDELDFALDILRVVRAGLLSDDVVTEAAAHCVSYALEALDSIRPFVNTIEGRTRQ